jgi:hypothetical protein
MWSSGRPYSSTITGREIPVAGHPIFAPPWSGVEDAAELLTPHPAPGRARSCGPTFPGGRPARWHSTTFVEPCDQPIGHDCAESALTFRATASGWSVIAIGDELPATGIPASVYRVLKNRLGAGRKDQCYPY